MSLLGVILAGGESRRFGSPKCLARLHGRPLWSRAAAALQPCSDGVVAVANDPRLAEAMSLETRRDLRPGLGPLGGVETALAWAADKGSSGALVLAGDMPWFSRETSRMLTSAWEGNDAVAFRSAGPWGFEPLCAAYPVSWLPRVTEALDRGDGSVGMLLESGPHRLIDPPAGSPRVFASVNTPEDLPPPTVAVVGNKKSGKTTLTVALLAELARRGRRVMSAKHGHHFRLDTEGTDSWRHRHEGSAQRVLLAGPEEFALMGAWADDGEPDLEDLVLAHLADAEMVVAEGFRSSRVPKVEIYRSGAQPEPILDPEEAANLGCLAAVTDRPDLPWSVPVFDPDGADLPRRLADLLEDALLGD